LCEDCRTGLPLLKVMDHIEPGIVDWTRVLLEPKSIFERTANCNYACDLARSVPGIKLVGIAGSDLSAGSPKLTLAIWWQLMRKDMMRFLDALDVDAEHVRAWANAKVKSAGCGLQMSRFSDPMLASGTFLLTLLGAVAPECVNKKMGTLGTTRREAELNARYAVSAAHKMGCRVFILWEDIVQVRPKMMLSLLAAALTVDMQRSGLTKHNVLEKIGILSDVDTALEKPVDPPPRLRKRRPRKDGLLRRMWAALLRLLTGDITEETVPLSSCHVVDSSVDPRAAAAMVVAEPLPEDAPVALRLPPVDGHHSERPPPPPGPPPARMEAELPSGWEEHANRHGLVYYHHVGTGETSWTRPR